jgi:glycosyltransferase involved in cell wall biosynthesis
VIDQDRESFEIVSDLPVVRIFRPGKGGALSAWNDGLKVSRNRGHNDLSVLGADDLVFNPGWYEEMLKTAETGDYIGLTYYQRGNDRWPTHYAVTRKFMIDYLNGSLGMDAYHHNCTDLESWSRALIGHGYVEGREIIQHKHPAYGTAPIDQTYLDGAFFAEKDDLNLFYERKRQGFPNSWEPAITECE